MDEADPKTPKQLALEGVIAPARSTSKARVRRLLDRGDATDSDPDAILYSHSILCQTGLPYRDPGDDRREWERVNGAARLKVLAGEALHPRTGRFVPLGLPFGPKPRLILAHLNGEALRQGSPEVEVDDSLTAFVKRLKLNNGARTITTVKEQLARLAASSIRLGFMRDGHAITVNSQIVTAFDLWFPKEGQRVLWPSALRLSADYFQSLQRHAVPLHEHALAALSGNAMGLDVYAWLAQRLHRVQPFHPVRIGWPALQAQFGWHYERISHFKPEFSRTVQLVHSQYRAARIELDEDGMCLRHSPSPVRGRTLAIIRKP